MFCLLNLTDLQIGLTDLLTTRHTALTSTKVGKAQEEVLAAQKKEIDDLPASLTGKRPLVEELGVKDDEHDGLGGGIWHVTEAHLRVPGVDPSVVAAAHRIRAAFIPELANLTESYADEAAAADRRKDAPTALEADLKLFPVAGGKTLHDWALSFVAAGQDLSKLLSQRADLTPASRKRASSLRSETIAILNDLRRAIAREQKRSTSLPSDIDAQIFGYLDVLEEQRATANRAAKNKGGAPDQGNAAPTGNG